ncbi:MAG: hypothetical protein ABSH51_28855 [Solirubrobacteraceae bacterium]
MTAPDFDEGRSRLTCLQDWWLAEGQQNRNEATTRLHLVDELIFGVLSWPKAAVTAEDSYAGKYADYSLGMPATRVILEAKREGVYFELPAGVGARVVGLSNLFGGNAAFEAAARQALGYCLETPFPHFSIVNSPPTLRRSERLGVRVLRVR